MGKTLLRKFTGNLKVNGAGAAVLDKNENKALIDLLQELKPHLQEAANDLLHPRQEAIDNILKKAALS